MTDSSHEIASGRSDEELIDNPKPLRPLTSLKWPYVPEESAYPDPLKRNDPKPLQVSQYEAIGIYSSFELSICDNCVKATSPSIRTVLGSHPRLPGLLTSLDKLRGPDRERALQRALGVTPSEISSQSSANDPGEDVLALRALAEAVEAAVRAGKSEALGLDWGE